MQVVPVTAARTIAARPISIAWSNRCVGSNRRVGIRDAFKNSFMSYLWDWWNQVDLPGDLEFRNSHRPRVAMDCLWSYSRQVPL